MAILAQFLLRLAFGLAVGMGITSSRQVSSGYFRNHLYVTLGLSTLAALVLVTISSTAMWFAAAAALLSYFGSAAWLYESPRFGKIDLWLVAACAIAAAIFTPFGAQTTTHSDAWHTFAIVSSGAVLGITFAAMLLGHWYLNAPGMMLAPLRRLLVAAAIAVGIQAAVLGVGLAMAIGAQPATTVAWLLFVLLRLSFG